MAIYSKGGDPEAMHAAASRLGITGRDLEAVVRVTDGAVRALATAWGGPDLVRLREGWSRARPGLVLAVAAVQSMQRTLEDNAVQQRQASSSPVADPHGEHVGPMRPGETGSPGEGVPTAQHVIDPGGRNSGTPPSPPKSPPPPPPLPPTGQLPTHDGYREGPPEPPPGLTYDDDFPWGSKRGTETLSDAALATKWQAIRDAGLMRPDLQDAAKLYAHFWQNTGTPVVVDYEKAYRDDAVIRRSIDVEMGKTARAVDEMAKAGGQDFSVTGPKHALTQDPATENWQKTLGKHNQWSSANVHVKDGMVTMTVTVHADDQYNFNKGASDIATGAKDAENGRMEELGWARSFHTSGAVTRTITWPVGSPPPI